MHVSRSVSLLVPVALCASLLLLAVPAAVAQVPKAAAKTQAPKIPEPEDVTLETKDGYNIRATWYAGTGKKASVPIIMVHGWDGQRGDYDLFAKWLQGNFGHAILVPDMRGHGESTTRRMPNGETRQIETASLGRKDIEDMIWDLEACKKFLRERNNDGELNIESLCLIAGGEGCIPAVRWTVLDWSAPRLRSFKQGQDVKALVLLSPVLTFKGASMREALAHPVIRRTLSVMIVAGKEDRSGSSEARRMFTSLESQRPKVSKDDAPDKQDLFFDQPPTSLSGTKLLGPGVETPGRIANFIKLRLSNRQAEFAWSERKSPLGN
jgi:pimeloyl-ACP methyl ester carboxylesterase